jgi:hypothetical protein
MYLKRSWYSGNNIFGFHEWELSQEYPVLTNLLDVFKNEKSDEVHRFLLIHRVNGSPEGVQRTNTNDDVHDGMVVHNGHLMMKTSMTNPKEPSRSEI